MYCWADDVASLFKTKKVRVRFNVAFRLDNVVIAVIAPTSKRDSTRISKKTSPYTIRTYSGYQFLARLELTRRGK